MKKIAFLLLASFLFFSCEKEFEQSDEVIITTPDLKFTETVTNVSVFGGTDGKISINVTSGMPPYKYKLGNGEFQTASVFENLTVGTYKITVEDGVKKTAFKDIAITQPAEVVLPLVFNLSSTNVSAWGLSDGSITTNVTSGMPPYSYSLSNGPTNSTGVFTNLVSGNYTVTVTDSRQQTGSKSILITQPPQPTPIHTISSISGRTEVTGLNLDFMQNRNSFTISFWYNTPTDQVSQDPAYSGAWLISTDHSENPVGESQTQVLISKTFIEYTRGTQKLTKMGTAWKGLHHVVILYDGSNMKMYQDNELISAVSSTNLSFNKLYLGGHYIHDYYTYNGVISKVKFYNSALTDSEVDYLYKN